METTEKISEKNYIVSVSGTLTYEVQATSKEDAIEKIKELVEIDKTVRGVDDWEVMFVSKSKRTKIFVT